MHNKKYLVAIYWIKVTYGSSAGTPPSHVNIPNMTTRAQKIALLFGLRSKNGTNICTRMNMSIAITPPTFLGTDRNIA